jgi:peptidoglycan/xylan/chitin deacetylase (PgdA/CDA1 family)
MKRNVKGFCLYLVSFLIRNKLTSKYIYYHDIHSDNKYTDMSTPVELFLKHIDLIRSKGYEIVTEITKSEGQIAIAFDDGFLGLHDNFHLLLEKKVPVTLYIVCDFLDKNEFISVDSLIEMLSTEFLTLGSHTCTHSNLAGRTEKEIANEIIESKNKLEEIFKIEIKSLCFPRGIYSDFVVEESLKAGYKCVFSSVPGDANLVDFVKRRNLVQHANAIEFKAILSGVMSLFSKRYVKQHKV